jgi:hypothetical protein
VSDRSAMPVSPTPRIAMRTERFRRTNKQTPFATRTCR